MHFILEKMPLWLCGFLIKALFLQGTGSSSPTYRNWSDCQTKASEFFKIVVNRAGLCLLSFRVSLFSALVVVFSKILFLFFFFKLSLNGDMIEQIDSQPLVIL